MRPDLLHILQHSLGLDQYGKGSFYRNYFSTGPGSTDFPKCMELVGMGLMKDNGPQSITGGDHYFSVTDDGRRAIREHSPNPPRVTVGFWTKKVC